MSKIKRIFSFIFFCLCAQLTFAQGCQILNSLEILDNDTSLVTIVVEGAINDTLGQNGQGICGVQIEFQHEFVADLLVELISPSGQSIVLMGPPTTNSFATSNITWDISFVPCTFPAAPDPGFSAVWNNIQAWAILATYTGSYYPFFGCLEDFNGTSVNGSWTLRFIDDAGIGAGELLNFSILFCDNDGLSCFQCDPNGGNFNDDQISHCEGDPNLNFVLNPDYGIGGVPPNVYSYLHLVENSNNELLAYDAMADLTNLESGFYEVCGLSILDIELSSLPILDGSFGKDSIENLINEGAICADFTTGCRTVEIYNVPDTTFLTEFICASEIYTIGSNNFDTDGIYTVDLFNGQCDSTIVLDLTIININAEINANSNQVSCLDPNLTLFSANSTLDNQTSYLWTTADGNIVGANDLSSVQIDQGGTFQLLLEDSGCKDSVSIVINDLKTSPEIIFDPDTLSCSNITATLSGSSPDNIISYSWIGPLGDVFNTQDITVDVPGQYLLSIVNDFGCENTDSLILGVDFFLDVPVLQADTINCDSITADIIGTIDNPANYTFNWYNAGSFSANTLSIEVTEGGTYFLDVIGNNGCSETHTLEVVEEIVLPSIALDVDTLRCTEPQGNVIVISEPDATIEWIDPSFSGFNNITGVQGSYDFTVTGANGCEKDSFVMVSTDVSLPDFTLVNDVLNCADSIQLMNVFNNISPTSIFDWSGPFGFNSMEMNPFVYNQGRYILTVTNEDGCAYTDTLRVSLGTDNPDINLVTEPVACVDGLGNIAAVGSVNDYTFQWAGPGTFQSSAVQFDITVAGFYKVTVTDISSGCTSVFATIVDEEKEDIELTTAATVLDCSNTEGTLSYSTPETVLNTTWSDSNGVIATTAEANVTNVGWYYLNIELTNNCVYLDSVEVLQSLTPPNIFANDTIIGCGQGSIALEVEVTETIINYNWSGPNGFMSNLQNPLASDIGTYSVTITDDELCTSEISFEVDVDQNVPSISQQGDLSLDCNMNESFIEIVSDGDIINYNWSGPQSIGNQSSATIDQSGFYTVIITASNLCTNTIDFEITTESTLPQFQLTSTPISCSNNSTGTIVVNSMDTGLSYDWSGPNGFTSALDQIVVTQAGEYTVVVSNMDDCTVTQSVEIISDVDIPVITNTMDGFLDCNDINAIIGVESSSDIEFWNWSGPNGFSFDQQFPVVSEPGIYNVEVIDSFGCKIIESIEVGQDTIRPIVQVDGSNINCLQSKVEISFTVNDPDAVWNWTGPDGFTSNEINPIVDEPGVYQVVLTAQNGCSTVKTYEVIEDFAEPSIEAFDLHLPCDSSPINLEVSSDTQGATFIWFGPNNFFSEQQSPLTDILGDYIVVATGLNGCISRDTITLDDIPVPPFFDYISGTITCENPVIDLTATFVDDDAGVEWIDLDGTSSFGPVLPADTPGEYLLIVTGSNACKDSLLIELLSDTIVPNASAFTDDVLKCTINSIRLDGTNSELGNFYAPFWTTPDGNILEGANTYEPIINTPGTYYINVRDTRNGCIGVDSVIVDEAANSLEEIIFETTNPLCFGFTNGSASVSGTLGGNAPYTYGINDGFYSSILDFNFLPPGDHQLSVKDSAGCTLDTIFQIQDGRDLEVFLGPDTLINLGQTINIQALSNVDFAEIVTAKWNPGPQIPCSDCMDITLTPTETIQLEIEIEDINGCVAEDFVIIRVEDKSPIYVPNIFSPNEDDANDRFMIFGGEGVEQIDYIHILDRWGNIVFERFDFQAQDATQAWDGIYRGKPLQPAVFSYILGYTMINGIERVETGTITLIK